MSEIKLNAIEKEVIFLKAINEFIHEMVNFEIAKILGTDPHSEFHFKSSTHQKYFNIILTDFLSKSEKRIVGENIPYLQALDRICSKPNFDVDNSIKSLLKTTKDFRTWLEKEVEVEKIWLPSIDLETSLKIKRIEFIKICGSMSKHNFSRLSGVICKLREIFKRNGIKLSEEKALLIFDEFYEWFHKDIFNYHSSAIAEFLNNIRWGIYEYLQPEFHRSYVWEGGNPPRWRYTYPNSVSNKFAQECYWELIGDVKTLPFMRKFQVTKYLKMRY